ncbi:hypothetical protein HDV03_003496 [Kappamyces sp. JEL0829]|nr:hypothetical protein HDV03_003496 [Kappamyces sp. JEL0829]
MDEYVPDAFEIHQQFVSCIESITNSANSSARTIGNASHFAYEHSDYYEGSLPRILESGPGGERAHSLTAGLFTALMDAIKQQSPPKRLSLFYLIDALLKHPQRAEFSGYTQLVLDQLPEICDLVAALYLDQVVDAARRRDKDKQTKSGGVANIPSVCKVLSFWRQKDYIKAKVYEKLNRHLTGMMGNASVAPAVKEQSWSKDQILRKMEEDRDRVRNGADTQQKKAREESWTRPLQQPGAVDAEFKMAWDKARRPSNDDYRLFERYAARLHASRERI